MTELGRFRLTHAQKLGVDCILKECDPECGIFMIPQRDGSWRAYASESVNKKHRKWWAGFFTAIEMMAGSQQLRLR